MRRLPPLQGVGCFPCHMSPQQEQGGPTALLRGLLATVSFTSPGPGCFPADTWTPQPPQLVSGSLAEPSRAPGHSS